ncbi:SRPBCC family protein [Antarcticibacterium sp. 1MA-6-2]|uniref:SRPBCC family protein n=1 Tax=Antarcticibacterium sp. 1MA-6-2 TaxID=2908210 RepID=UPI001F45E22C|nr:SRPBCC family protein [Antarcticibacterium sp. 1MA-6-2]UJH92785.1 SRPBCC family protein [Antarcticibacterium sp. 1MA-6-2]
MENAEFIRKGEAGTVHITNPDSNLSNNRTLAAAGGAFLAFLGLKRGGFLGILAAATGGSLLYKGASGKWPWDELDLDSSANTDIDISTSVIINEPREVLYAYWRKLENLPNFMKHLEEVDEVTNKRSQWKARIPGGLGNLEWEAEIIQEEENSLLAWRALPDSEIQNSGEVRFEEIPGSIGTRVTTRISYRPPAGELGEMAAKVLNPSFSKIIKQDLQRFKDFVETGNYKNPAYDLWEGRKPSQF